MGSPLTLGKSKRWLARRRVTCEAPDRCEARECVQERRRAATKRRITQLVDLIVFSALSFLSHPCSVRVTLRDSSAGPTGSPLFVSKAFYPLSWSVQGKSAVVLYLPSTLSLSNHALQQHSLSRMHMHMSLHSITWC